MAKEKTDAQLRKEAKKAIKETRQEAKEQERLNKFKEEELQLAKDIAAYRKSGLSAQGMKIKEFQKELRIQEKLVDLEEEKKEFFKTNTDLLSSTNDISKALTKEIRAQAYSQKNISGINTRWLKTQQAGLATITGIVDGSE